MFSKIKINKKYRKGMLQKNPSSYFFILASLINFLFFINTRKITIFNCLIWIISWLFSFQIGGLIAAKIINKPFLGATLFSLLITNLFSFNFVEKRSKNLINFNKF